MTGTETISHPVFSRFYDRISRRAEAAGAAEHRDELLDGLTGTVIEVGTGNGLTFAHYPTTATEVVAVEPEPYLRAKATEAAADARVPIKVVDGTADSLPAEDGEFDAAVASLVLCSVPQQTSALAELHRVLRPGGELRFYEHVKSARRGVVRMQHLLDATVWPWIAGGCHTGRDTLTSIRHAGFTVDRCREFEFRPFPGDIPTAPRILGVARRT